MKYAPGTLLAKASKGGQVVAQDQVETTGAPAAIKLIPDRSALQADGEDVSILTVAVTDSQGRTMPVAGNLVRFELTGPGRILGVGNGDPSCHEADVFISQPQTRPVRLEAWHMKDVETAKDSPETAAKVDDAAWRNADVKAAWGPLQPGKSAVYRTRFTLKADDLKVSEASLAIGMIDDDGWVYVNGQFAGESHDWSASPTFNIRRFLQEGENTLAVAVKNNASSGGLNKGVDLSLVEKAQAADWKRSVFNGLAQILVQGTREPGVIKLEARSEGLTPASVSLESKACTPRPSVP